MSAPNDKPLMSLPSLGSSLLALNSLPLPAKPLFFAYLGTTYGEGYLQDMNVHAGRMMQEVGSMLQAFKEFLKERS